MKRYLLCTLLALLALTVQAQSLTITETLKPIEHSSVMAQYQNEFGKHNMPEKDISFPFALIRMQLSGNEQAVLQAKQKLLLDLGTMQKVEDIYRDKPNELLFLVPMEAKNIYITCGDGCERQHLYTGQLRPNLVYICRVSYIPSQAVYSIAPQITSQYLQFRVEPADASVEVNGEMWKVNEGSARKYVLFGEYSYVVKAPDYKQKEGTVTVNDLNNTKVVTVKLEPNFAQVTFKVDNNAEIWIDGEQKGTGQWTGNVGFGVHQMITKKPSHREQIRTQSIAPTDAGKIITLTSPTPIYGSLNLDVLPDDATIWLDGKQVGTTPRLLPQVLIGEHSLKITKSGYSDYTTTVTVIENQVQTLSATMEKNASGISASSAGNNLTFTIKGQSFTMVSVQGGTFTMGATSEQGSDAYSDEKPAHSVTLSDYYIGQTEVTQGLWQAVMGSNPSYFNKGDSYPVEEVSWDDCQDFIRKLNSQLSSQLGGKRFALPTEAQWEYAARGGNKSQGYKYSGSNTLSAVAWYKDNSGDNTHPVAQKQSNELGLYDMSGNVWEWCQDWYGSYSSSSQTNPTGPSTGSDRVNRGGGWFSSARSCRVSIRSNNSPSYRSISLGLRLVLLP